MHPLYVKLKAWVVEVVVALSPLLMQVTVKSWFHVLSRETVFVTDTT